MRKRKKKKKKNTIRKNMKEETKKIILKRLMLTMNHYQVEMFILDQLTPDSIMSNKLLQAVMIMQMLMKKIQTESLPKKLRIGNQLLIYMEQN